VVVINRVPRISWQAHGNAASHLSRNAAMDVFLRMNEYQWMTSSQEVYQVIFKMFERRALDIEHIGAWVNRIIVKR
jgi:GrpB-like predicted nucleotidyltransferase (UPF0157 family)